MRLISTISLPILTICTLVACGESDEAFRANYRTKAVADCARGANSQSNPTGVNMNQLCGCMVDGYMRVTPTDRLKAERDQSEAPPAANAAMRQCVGQALQGRMSGSAAPSNSQ
jgi:hypothetical protein